MAGFHIRSLFRSAEEPQTHDYTADKLAEKWQDLSGTDGSGVVVTASSAMKFSAFWACVRLLSELPASLERNVCILNSDGYWEVDKNHYLNALIDSPNILMDPFTCDETMFQSLQINGNSLGIIYADKKGYPSELLPVPWNYVDVRISNRQLFYKVNYPKLNINETFPAASVLHYKILSPDGLIGRSVIQHAMNNVALGIEAENFGSQFFRKGGHIKGVIESEGEFKSDDAYRKWLQSFKKRFSTVKNNFDVPLLERGMKYHELNMPLEQAQFLQTRQFQLADICRWFLVPPHLIADLTKSSYSTIEQQSIQFVKYTLRSLIKKIEKEMAWKLIPAKDRGKVSIRFNLESLLRGDMAARSAFYHTMATDGIYTRNEIRRFENMRPLPGLDEPMTPANIVGKQAEITNNQKSIKNDNN